MTNFIKYVMNQHNKRKKALRVKTFTRIVSLPQNDKRLLWLDAYIHFYSICLFIYVHFSMYVHFMFVCVR